MRTEIDFDSPIVRAICLGLLGIALLFTIACLFKSLLKRRKRPIEKPKEVRRPRVKAKDLRVSENEVPPGDEVLIHTRCPRCGLGVKVPRGRLKTIITCRDCEREFTA